MQKIARRRFLEVFAASVGGSALVAAGCGSRSGIIDGCSRSVALPSRFPSAPSSALGGAYNLIKIDFDNQFYNASESRIARFLPAGLNQKGQIVTSHLSTQGPCPYTFLADPYRYTPQTDNRGFTSRKLSDDRFLVVFCINDAEQTAGQRSSGLVLYTTYLQSDSRSNAVQNLDRPKATWGGWGTVAINNAGAVLGLTTDHTFLYTAGTYSDLPNPEGFRLTGTALGDDGMVVGFTERILPPSGTSGTTEYRPTAPFVYRNGTVTVLPIPAGYTVAKALHRNSAGQILSVALTADNIPHAVLYQDDLPILFGPDNFMPRAINAGGDIVGVLNGKGVLWKSGVLTDLNMQIASGTGWKITDAYAINNKGAIAAQATFGTGADISAYLVALLPS